MEIIIDIDIADPLFAQLMEQIKNAVISGSVLPGDALPSIRQLANDLGVNNKTVAKAYRLLERDNVIQTKGYRGTYVHPEAIKNSSVDLPALVKAKLDAIITDCRDAGATDSEIRIAFAEVMQNPPIGGQ
ncbi:MAG: GntR family transcriptional regulator [Kordiimonadaceae bacterium]|nr:GntR family transcriptional regulator [Kordiimonadaceae bacterium]